MRQYALLLSALPLALAGDSSGFVFCGETKPDVSVCLQRVPDSCYDCLHPIETSCGDSDKDASGYASCFCAVPGKSWSAIEKCLRDTSTGCADSQKYILNTYGVECATSARKDQFQHEVCEVQQTDPLAKALAEVHCGDASTNTDKPTDATQTVSQTASLTGTTTTAPGTTTGSGGSGSHSTSLPSSSRSGTVPVSTAGASSWMVDQLKVAAIAVIGAAVNI